MTKISSISSLFASFDVLVVDVDVDVAIISQRQIMMAYLR
jgi:hypothetical protein